MSDARLNSESRWRQLRRRDEKKQKKKAPLDVLREDKMDSPIHTNCIQPGGANTLIFIVNEATPSVPSSYAQ